MSTDLEHDPNPTMTGPVPDLPEVTDEHEPVKDLHYTRKVRGMIVKGLAGNGVPTDPKALGMLLNTLKDLDSSALGVMRIKSEEADQNLQAKQQALVREFLAQSAGVRPPTRQQASNAPTEPPSLADGVSTRDFVPGELQQGTVHGTFDEFAAARGDVTLAKEDKLD